MYFSFSFIKLFHFATLSPLEVDRVYIWKYYGCQDSDSTVKINQNLLSGSIIKKLNFRFYQNIFFLHPQLFVYIKRKEDNSLTLETQHG